MKSLLHSLACIAAGYTLRGRVEHVPDGALALVQLKDVNPVLGLNSTELARIHPVIKREPDYLRPGDILFVNRGLRFFGVLLEHPLEHAVAAPHFFVVRPTREMILPAYLAWFLNHKRAQRYFSQGAAGTALPHITTKTLGELPVDLPDRKTQQAIAGAHACLLAERKLSEELLEKRQGLVTEMLDRALHGATPQE